MVCRDSKVDNFADFLVLLLIIIRYGLWAEIRWSVCISKSHRNLWVSFSRKGAGLCIYHLLAWSNLNFLHISQWITLPTLTCLALYSFCANLMHSLIMWLIIIPPLEFFTSVLADDFSLEFEWQQVSSSLQNLSQYSGRPQQCCRLDSLYPSANFQVLQAL